MEDNNISISTRMLDMNFFKPMKMFIAIFGGSIFAFTISLNQSYNDIFLSLLSACGEYHRDNDSIRLYQGFIICLKYLIAMAGYFCLLKLASYMEGRHKYHVRMVLKGYYLQAGRLRPDGNDVYQMKIQQNIENTQESDEEIEENQEEVRGEVQKDE